VPFVLAEDGVGDEAGEESEGTERLGSDLEGCSGPGKPDGHRDESEADRDAEAAGTPLDGVPADCDPAAPANRDRDPGDQQERNGGPGHEDRPQDGDGAADAGSKRGALRYGESPAATSGRLRCVALGRDIECVVPLRTRGPVCRFDVCDALAGREGRAAGVGGVLEWSVSSVVSPAGLRVVDRRFRARPLGVDAVEGDQEPRREFEAGVVL